MIVLAFDGPTPMLTRVMPVRPGAIKCQAGILVAAPGAVADQLLGIVARLDHDPAGTRDRSEAAVRPELRARPADEIVDRSGGSW